MHKNDTRLAELENLASLMDARFIIPGTNIHFGLDSLVGLIPGIGDTIGLAVSAYIVHRAMQHNLPRHIKVRMVTNIAIDWLIGAVPVVGDLFDVKWKANIRNVELLRRHLRGP
ncbi:MAG: hypothetical protein JWO78_1493 [Micavibrio sp.]|nr:hypothetical protein [Micavibrio sp.]